MARIASPAKWQEWEDRFARFERQGLPIRQFCEAEGVKLTPFPNPDPDLVRESSCPGWGWKGFSDEEATQCRADRGLASAG